MARPTAVRKRAAPSYRRLGLTPYVYRVVVEPDEDRFFAEIPSLPGCHSWGYTYEEALKNIKEALELWLQVKKEAGEEIPLEDPQTIKNATHTIGVLA
ncbi:MAG: type II toxin-antitoxin system HicB family antitoxin [Acidobacteria bacterium]|nr:type II toxin-antitoxin system HicB family antitoxin [Acidobacteriota bacterium]